VRPPTATIAPTPANLQPHPQPNAVDERLPQSVAGLGDRSRHSGPASRSAKPAHPVPIPASHRRGAGTPASGLRTPSPPRFSTCVEIIVVLTSRCPSSSHVVNAERMLRTGAPDRAQNHRGNRGASPGCYHAVLTTQRSIGELLGAPDALEAMAAEDRARVTRHLLARLGGDWAATTPGTDGIFLVHRPTAVEVSVVPGGSLEMGLCPRDVEEIGRHLDIGLIECSIEGDSVTALPCHRVEVRPFLAARKALPEGTMHRAEAIEKVTALGFRLPSEAELEWILRDGGRYALTLGATPVAGKPGRFTFRPSRYGIDGLFIANWAADDWHPTYQGAPATSVPWGDGDPAGVCRSTFPLDAMVSEEDIAVLFAALRAPGSESMPCVARLARDLPFD